jgi:hypothetical protein
MNTLNGSLYAIYKYNSVSADVLESGLRTGSRPVIISSFCVRFTRRFSGFPVTSLLVYNGVCMSSSSKKSYKLDGFILVVLCHPVSNLITSVKRRSCCTYMKVSHPQLD